MIDKLINFLYNVLVNKNKFKERLYEGENYFN